MQHRHLHWPHLDDIIMACATAIPDLAPIVEAAPNARFRIKGMKLARSPQRYSGRTAMLANHNVHEPRVAQDSDTAFAFSMEGYSGSQQPFQQVPFAWAPGWNSPSAWNKFQDEVGGHLRAGDPGLRLFEAQDGQAQPYQQAIPERFVAHESTWQVVDRAQLFGSDELSMRAPLIAERAGELSAGISGADLSRLGLKEGDKFHFRWHDQQWSLPLRVMDGLAPGLLALPLGHPAVGWCLHHQTVHQEENA